VLRLTLFAIFELQCFAKNVLLKSRPNAMPQTVTSTTMHALLVFAFSSQAHTPLNKTQDLCFAVFGFA
jgi:hypothetical protein